MARRFYSAGTVVKLGTIRGSGPRDPRFESGRSHHRIFREKKGFSRHVSWASSLTRRQRLRRHPNQASRSNLPKHSAPGPRKGCLQNFSGRFCMDSSGYLRIRYRSHESITFMTHLSYPQASMYHLAYYKFLQGSIRLERRETLHKLPPTGKCYTSPRFYPFDSS